MSKQIPVIVVNRMELEAPETLGQKVREFLLRNHQESAFYLVMPERKAEPVTSRDPGTEI